MLIFAAAMSAPLITNAFVKELPQEAKEKGKETLKTKKPASNKVVKKKPQGISRAAQKADETASYFYVPNQRFYSQGIGGHDYLTVEARNTDWRVLQYPEGWVKISDKSNNGLRLDFAENTSKNRRATFMEIGNDNDSYIIEIYQNGMVKFEVTAIDFANTDTDGEKFYSDFGSPLYSHDLNFLLPRITYNGPEKAVAKNANVRIIFPDGTIDEVEKEGDYTYEFVLNCETGEGNTANLYPWGANVRRGGIPYYLPGDYALQLWIDDELAFTQPFKVKLKPNDYGAEITDYWVDHNVDQDGETGMLVHARVNSQNMDGYKINYCVFIADEEGNQLRDNRDRHVSFFETEDVCSNDYYWNDWALFVPYSKIREALKGEKKFSYKIEIQNAETFRPLSRIKGLTYQL